uniref:Uncharacterized protein n=1 Tax=Xanthomonas citri pv. phaseoli var. fuscans TaxID=473423 RepID=A0A808FE96_XANCI
MPKLKRDEVVDERWKRLFIWQLHVFTKEIGFCESFSHVCRLNPNSSASSRRAARNRPSTDALARRIVARCWPDRQSWPPGLLSDGRPLAGRMDHVQHTHQVTGHVIDQ